MMPCAINQTYVTLKIDPNVCFYASVLSFKQTCFIEVNKCETITSSAPAETIDDKGIVR